MGNCSGGSLSLVTLQANGRPYIQGGPRSLANNSSTLYDSFIFYVTVE